MIFALEPTFKDIIGEKKVKVLAVHEYENKGDILPDYEVKIKSKSVKKTIIDDAWPEFADFLREHDCIDEFIYNYIHDNTQPINDYIEYMKKDRPFDVISCAFFFNHKDSIPWEELNNKWMISR